MIHVYYLVTVRKRQWEMKRCTIRLSGRKSVTSHQCLSKGWARLEQGYLSFSKMRIQYLDEVFSVKRQVYMVTRRLVHLSIVFLLVTLSCQFIRSIIPPEENSAAVGSALLNEVLFLPAQGEAGFVEIKSPGKRVSLEGLYLMNERGDSYSLPDDVNTLSPDEFLLIIFDGTNSLDDK